MGLGVGDDGLAADDGVVEVGDAGLEGADLGGLLLDDVALDIKDVVEAVGVGLHGVGAHVDGPGVSPGAEPPEAGHGAGSDGDHVGGVGERVRHQRML
ncbi:MAG: hypothetical protein EBW87_03710 [Burkholderiaceae bacterium]|nr:hypothetical protein [Burkholderiaceae bacterium]